MPDLRELNQIAKRDGLRIYRVSRDRFVVIDRHDGEIMSPVGLTLDGVGQWLCNWEVAKSITKMVFNGE